MTPGTFSTRAAPRSPILFMSCHSAIERIGSEEPALCHSSPALTRRGGGEGWHERGSRRTSLSNACLWQVEGAEPTTSRRYTWPAWVITSQHFILLVSFCILGMWAPKYFILACSCMFLSGQTTGQLLALNPGPSLAELSLGSCYEVELAKFIFSMPLSHTRVSATSPALTPLPKGSRVKRPGRQHCWKLGSV